MEKATSADVWIETHEKLMDEIASWKRSGSLNPMALEQRIKTHLRSSLMLTTDLDFKRLLVRQVYESLWMYKLPFNYSNQDVEIEALLTSGAVKTAQDAENIQLEVVVLLNLISFEDSNPIPNAVLQKAVETKISLCGNHQACDSAKFLYLSYQSRLARLSGDWEAVKRHDENAAKSLVIGMSFLPLDIQQVAKIYEQNGEIYLLLAQSKLKRALETLKNVQKIIDSTIYEKALTETNPKIAAGYLAFGWQMDSGPLEAILAFGQNDIAVERSVKVLRKYVNPLIKKTPKDNSEILFVKKEINELILKTTDLSGEQDANTNRYFGSDPKISISEGLGRITALIFLKDKFDGSDVEQIKKLTKQGHSLAILAKKKRQWIPKDLYQIFNQVDVLAEKKVTNPAVSKKLEDDFSTKIATFSSVSNLVSNAHEPTAFRNFSEILLTNGEQVAYVRGQGLVTRSHFTSNARSFLYKVYADSIQEVRKEFNPSHVAELKNFINKHNHSLRKGSEFFFSIGDTASGEALIRLAKEHTFQAYLRDGQIGIKPQSFEIPLSPIEKRFIRKFKVLREEFLALSHEFKSLELTPEDPRAPQLQFALDRTWQDLTSEVEKLRVSAKGLVHEPRVSNTQGTIETPVIYANVRDEGVSFILKDSKRSKQVFIEIDRQELRKTVFELLFFLSNNDERWEATLTKFFEQFGQKLFDELSFFPANEIYIVPDDVLGLVPWNLVSLSNSSKRISGVLILSPSKPKPPNTPLTQSSQGRVLSIDAFVNSTGGENLAPLPYAESEGRFLITHPFKNISPKSSRNLYLNRDFSLPSFVRSLNSDKDVIHIATHFQVLGKGKSASGFLLGDGSYAHLTDLLSRYESFNTIKLMTLSSCESYLSLQRISDLSIANEGMATFFSRVGVETVIGTLWKISDQATYDFMRIFYTYLLEENQSVSNALYNTIAIFRDNKSNSSRVLYEKYPLIFTKDLRKRVESYRSPFYWAAFAPFISSSSLQ